MKHKKNKSNSDQEQEPVTASFQDKEEVGEEHINIFAQPILTRNDWAAFKIWFERTRPGFIQRLRTTYPKITEAEERLFLLLKLSLTSQEISKTIGISYSGVKKTRNRLRKKMKLSPEDNLKSIVQKF